MKVKRFAAILILLTIIFNLSFFTSAQQIDLSEWNNIEKVYQIADDDNESNSGLQEAQLKVQYDYPSHRMRLFFMLKFDSFTQEENIGIRFRLNDGENVSLHLNGETEYNEDKYILEFIHYSVPTSGVVFVEATFAVKEGIPEEQIFTVIFTDADAKLSNTYTVDITEAEVTTSAEATTADSEKPSKTKKNNSSGSVTKSKTEKKTGRTQTDKTTTSQEEMSEATILKGEVSETENAYGGQKVLCISAAAIIAVALLFTGGMYFLKRKNHKGDED